MDGPFAPTNISENLTFDPSRFVYIMWQASDSFGISGSSIVLVLSKSISSVVKEYSLIRFKTSAHLEPAPCQWLWTKLTASKEFDKESDNLWRAKYSSLLGCSKTILPCTGLNWSRSPIIGMPLLAKRLFTWRISHKRLWILGAVHKGYPTFKLVRGFAKIGYE